MLELLKKARSRPWETWNEERDIQVRIEKTESAHYVFFQETRTKMDWKINFTFWIKPYKRMNTTWFAHRGFVLSYKSIRDRLLKEIKDAETIVVSGFSQGAAYAILAHEDLKFHGYDVRTIAFAPPRVFWFWNLWKIRNRFEELTLVINRGDIVTKVPFFWWGYIHQGAKIKLGKRFRLPLHIYHQPDEYEKELKEQ